MQGLGVLEVCEFVHLLLLCPQLQTFYLKSRDISYIPNEKHVKWDEMGKKSRLYSWPQHKSHSLNNLSDAKIVWLAVTRYVEGGLE